MIMILLIVILSITALIVSAAKTRRPPVKTTPTPTPVPNAELVEAPTSSASQIPKEFQIQFNEIEKELLKTENFLPPQIDSALLP